MSWGAEQPDASRPLAEALRLQRKAAKLGFDWPAIEPLWDKLAEEVEELRAAIAAGQQQDIQDELGDLLFMLVNFARFLDVTPEQALDSVNRKFVRRLRHIEAGLRESGRDWQDASLDEMEALWQASKLKPDDSAR